MIDLSTSDCPVLAILRARCEITRQMKEKKERSYNRGTPVPDLASQFKEPEKTTGQRMVEWGWVPNR
jgi:hypothetical protein